MTIIENQTKLIYALEEKISNSKNILYGIQWAIFIYALNIMYPLVLGDIFNLSTTETTSLIQRSIFLIGLCSLIQVLWGHRLPIIDGVSSLWFSIFILTAQTREVLGENPINILPSLQFGLIVVGITLLFLSIGGLQVWLQKLFTPIVVGSTLILLTFQVSGTFVKGMLGYENGHINGSVAIFSIALASLVTFLGYKGSNWIKSISPLIGMLLGWGLYLLLGLPQSTTQVIFSSKLIYLPQLFPWGIEFSKEIILTALVSSLILISNQVASIAAISEALETKVPVDIGKKAGFMSGINQLLCGCFGGIGTVPISNSAGFISLTGVGTRTPFIIATLLLMLISIIWPLGQVFTLMPSCVAYAVSFTVFCKMMGIGFSNLCKVELNQRNLQIIGLTLVTGVGLMFVPATAYSNLPIPVQNIFSNGLLIGIIMALLLEHVIFQNKKSV